MTVKTSPMLSGPEVAKILGIHINTLHRWSNQGRIRTYRISPRGDRRFKQKDLDEFLKKRKQ